mmetsp:Transcript_50529/g.93447  ORF Transcript_50529/g.93447 Transcript_50529/m.93447 type:complete len:564 (-) Transcript_50529:56-1747(-)
MTEQCHVQMTNVDSIPRELSSDSSQSKAAQIKSEGNGVQDQVRSHKDLCGVDAIKRSNRKTHTLGLPPSISQSNLDKAISEVLPLTVWESDHWKKVKTLAAAASGEGSVVLMVSRKSPARKVAVKRLPLDLIGSCPEEFNRNTPEASERPWTDIAMVKHLNSLQFPWGCELLGVFLATNHVYIMTSLANGGDLFSWVEKDESKPGEGREAAMRPIVMQVFTAVCWLHNLGIAHRDLSAENVMLTDSSDKGLQVKIIDFGMATLSRFASKELRGKRSYQAPEMHSSSEYDTFLVDNFALGVVVYCMAAHYYPWEQTVPGKDRSCEFARANGLEIFLQKKRLPCCKKPIAEVYSKSLLELLCGLLDFDNETRYSLGEVCFAKKRPKDIDLWSSEAYAASDISTAASLESLPVYTEKTGIESLPVLKGAASLESLPAFPSCTPSLESLPPVERILAYPGGYPGTASLDSLPAFPATASLESLPPWPATASLESLPPMERVLPYPGTASMDSLPAFPGTSSLGCLPPFVEEESEEDEESDCSEHEDEEASQPIPARTSVWDCNWHQA